jgi:hypothetical protein
MFVSLSVMRSAAIPWLITLGAFSFADSAALLVLYHLYDTIADDAVKIRFRIRLAIWLLTVALQAAWGCLWFVYFPMLVACLLWALFAAAIPLTFYHNVMEPGYQAISKP